MTRLEGTRSRVPVLLIILTITLLCSLLATAQQDKLLTNAGNTTPQNSTANTTAVNCSAYDSNGNCTAGQYFHSDGTQYSPSWYTLWTTGITNPTKVSGTATVSGFGGWLTGLNAGGTTTTPSSPCISCHHSDPTEGGNYGEGGSFIGGNYLTGGHKNMLRKVAPGKQLWTTQGTGVTTDNNKNPIDWGTGNITVSGASKQLYYLYGWIDAPDAAYNGGSYTCARCHATGYRFDNAGPEPTQYNGSTAITDAQLTRTPSGGTCTVDPATNKTYSLCTAAGGTWATASWALTGIQCERCHQADMQYNANTVPATYNSGTSSAPVWTSTAGRISHLVSISVDPTKVDQNSCACTSNCGGTGSPRFSCNITAPIAVGDFTVFTVSPVGATLANPQGNGSFTGRPLPNVAVGEKSTALCIQCHRQEVSKTPTTAGGAECAVGTVCNRALQSALGQPTAYNLGEVHPAQLPGQTLGISGIADGTFKASGACSKNDPATSKPYATYSGCIAAGGTWPYVPSMSHGANGAQAFLNSPHARFNGTFDVKTQNSSDLSLVMNGTYNSWFTDQGQAPEAKTGSAPNGLEGTPLGSTKNGGCTNCHDIHNTLVKVGANPVAPTAEGMVRSCTSCHQNGSRYAVANVAHSGGDGTPFPTNGEPSTPCITCHMGAAGGSPMYHYFRINPSATYHTFPDAQTYYDTIGSGKNAQPLSYPESGFGPNGAYSNYQAVGLDVDIACGQCHTGGDGKSNPYGIKPTGAPVFTRASLSNLASGMHATVPKTAALPTFSLPGTTYPASQAPLSVTLYEAVNHAGICYTTDGSTPGWVDNTPTAEEATMVCTGTGTLAASGTTIQISQTTTLQAIGGGTNSIGNVLTPSGVASVTYKFQAPAPTFSVGSGQFNGPQSVQLSDVAGNILYCTVQLGGSCTPTTPYVTAIDVTVPTTIRAVAGGGTTGYTTSSVAIANYNFALASPTFSPGTGNYVGMQVVTLTGPAGSTVYYTTNGSMPTASSTSIAPSQTPGTPTTGTVNVGNSMYLRAIAVYTSGNQSLTSGVGTAVYTIQVVLQRPSRVSRDASTPAVPSAKAAVSSDMTATSETVAPTVVVIPTLAQPVLSDGSDAKPVKKAISKKKKKVAGSDEPVEQPVRTNSVGRNGQ